MKQTIEIEVPDGKKPSGKMEQLGLLIILLFGSTSLHLVMP